jgi:hypothetical protein
MRLLLPRANVSRISGHWQHEDFDVFDGDRDVGRIYPVDGCGDREAWFWGVSFQKPPPLGGGMFAGYITARARGIERRRPGRIGQPGHR